VDRPTVTLPDYQRLFEGATYPILIVDGSTRRILAANAAAVREYGYTREEFCALEIEAIRPDANTIRTKSGEPIEVLVELQQLSFAGRAAVALRIGNVTERAFSMALVEGQSRVLESIALERAGYEVHVAENGREAVELQRAHAADLLITDIFMPAADGMETIDRFKREYPRTRIIAMSGGVERMQDYLGIARQISVDATLRKPFTLAELLAAVRAVL
jgi:CheY-like chemotaxis protein